MDIRITILIDNEKNREDLFCEHGFSALIQAGQHRILFDTGASGQFLQNAIMLGEDLSLLTEVVLSHGHLDHTGGLLPLLERYPGCSAAFYLHRTIFFPKYAQTNGILRYVGAPFGPQDLLRKKIEPRYLGCAVYPLEPDAIWLLSGFEQAYPFEQHIPHFQIQNGAAFQLDQFQDEIAIAVDTSEGLVVLSGCSHNGMLNICQAAQTRLQRPVRAFLGGTHLTNPAPGQVEGTLAALQDGILPEVYVCHCTGEAGIHLLTQNCDCCRHIASGSVVAFH